MEKATIKSNLSKRIYSVPTVEIIKLDNEISLLLVSLESLPGGPGCAPADTQENFDNNAFL